MDWVQWFSLVVLALIMLTMLANMRRAETTTWADVAATCLVVLMLLVPFARVFKLI